MKKNSYLFALITILLCSCNSADESQSEDIEEIVDTEPKTEITAPSETKSISTVYTVVPFEKESNDWGYKIMDGDNLYINQPHIPAVQGNKGFSSEEKAITTGEFVIYKLNEGFVPPTVTREELDSLGVLD